MEKSGYFCFIDFEFSFKLKCIKRITFEKIEKTYFPLQQWWSIKNTIGVITKRAWFVVLMHKCKKMLHFIEFQCASNKHLIQKMLWTFWTYINTWICDQLLSCKLDKKNQHRCRQDSNLRVKIPMDFKSIALTTRPRQLWYIILLYTVMSNLW